MSFINRRIDPSIVQTITSSGKTSAKAPILSSTLATYLKRFSYPLSNIIQNNENSSDPRIDIDVISICVLKKNSFVLDQSKGIDKKSLKEEIDRIVDTLGQNSSLSQNLPHTITTSSKFNTNTEDQCIYLYLTSLDRENSENNENSQTLNKDQKDKKENTNSKDSIYTRYNSNNTSTIALRNKSTTNSTNLKNIETGKKVAVGILKTGIKHLFIRDKRGEISEFDALCVLDFYVHEDYQRQGIGKHLFDVFLDDIKGKTNVTLYRREKREKTPVSEPYHFAYDRPSPKLLGFLKKYFNLKNYAPQSNNYVVFDEYFEDTINKKLIKADEIKSNGIKLETIQNKFKSLSIDNQDKHDIADNKQDLVNTKTTQNEKLDLNQQNNSSKDLSSLKTIDRIGSSNISANHLNTLLSSPKKRTVLQQIDPISGQIKTLPGANINETQTNISQMIQDSSPRNASKMLKTYYEARPRPF